MADCHPSTTQDGGLTIQASAKALSIYDIRSATATISGPGIARPIVVPLGARGGTWQANVVGIPAGTGRSISVTARSQAGVSLFHGQAADVTIHPGETAFVNIVLFEVEPLPPYANAAPTIDVLEVSALKVERGASITVGVKAHDADPTDVLAYQWTASCGTLAEPTLARGLWTAPAVPGACEITVTVTDVKGASVSAGVAIAVVPPSRGGAVINTEMDRSPIIDAISLAPTPLAQGIPVTLTVSATDPDGHPLSYQWSSTCTGVFGNPALASTAFTLTSAPASGTCQFSADVADSVGAHSIGILNQATALVPVDQAPVIELASQSHGQLHPNQTAILSVEAADPDGQAITFTWSSADGTIAPIATADNASSVAFTAPAVLPDEPMHVTVMVTDTGGQATQLVFEFNRPNHVPVVAQTSIASSPMVFGEPAQLAVTVTDSDGDALTYAWSSTCVGSFDDATSSAPSFQLVSVPSGQYCVFSVVVTDAHDGQATGTLAVIVDHLPVVQSIALASPQILVGEPVGLSLVVADVDGDAWTVFWSRSCDGVFDDPTTPTPTFTLTTPPASGRCSFTATVTDTRGGRGMGSVVGPVGSAPDISDMQVGPLPLLVGQPAQLQVTAADADGDPLSYAWATDCAGTLASAQTPTPTFTLAEVPSNRLCIFQVLVSDGRGGTSLGQVSGQAGPIVVDEAPVIDASSQESTVVAPGQTVQLSVSAHDPEEQPVSYAWSSSDGSLSNVIVAPDTSYSFVSWTAPATLPSGAMHVTVIVADPSGLQSSVTFDFVGTTP
jgi:hypothetical protein